MAASYKLERQQGYDARFQSDYKVDPVHQALKAAQKPLTRYLWTPADAITFTPHVSDSIYGDGRALFGLGTINSRPAYWIVRGCSTWSLAEGDAPDDAPEIGEFIDEITMDLGYEFGDADDEPYEWIGNRLRSIETKRFMSYASISYPVLNYGGGSHWFRLDWPELRGVQFVQHPWAHRNILGPRHSAPGGASR